LQARATAIGVANVWPKIDLEVYAFAIMPDHFHLVVPAHAFAPDELIACLQRAATKELNRKGLHPLQDFPHFNGKLPSPWAARGWRVFLDKPKDMRRAIAYVEQNSVKAGLRRQHWSFVIPYEG